MNEPMAQVPDVKIAWIDDDDPRHVIRISQECFGPDAWTEDDIHRFMDKTDHIPMVMRVDDEVVGYNFYVLHDNLVFIRQLAVAQQHRRKGYATRMIKTLQRDLPRLRRRLIAVEVPERNLPAQVCFRECGFEHHKTLRRRGETDDRYALKYIAPKEHFR